MSETEAVPRILFFDIETFPNVGYTWGMYDQNVIRFIQQSCIATYSAKWYGEKEVFAMSLPDYPGYKPGSYDDKAIVADIWRLFNEADIIVAHNGDDFDIKICMARFIVHGLKPPAPFKSVDTKKMVKRVARFNSNKLDDLCSMFGFGHKIKTDFDLWEGCIKGDMTCWHNMVKYNKMDVLLLEKAYLRLLPFCKEHPNLSFWTRGKCPKCGSKDVQYRGVQRCITREYQRFQCNKCGSWGRTAKSMGSVSTTIAC